MYREYGLDSCRLLIGGNLQEDTLPRTVISDMAWRLVNLNPQ